MSFSGFAGRATWVPADVTPCAVGVASRVTWLSDGRGANVNTTGAATSSVNGASDEKRSTGADRNQPITIIATYHMTKDETCADMVPEVLEGEKRSRNGGICTSGLAPKMETSS